MKKYELLELKKTCFGKSFDASTCYACDLRVECLQVINGHKALSEVWYDLYKAGEYVEA